MSGRVRSNKSEEEGMKQLYFIINPQAKSGSSMKIWDEIRKELELRSIQFKSLFTEHRGHATMLAQSIGRKQGGEEAIIIVVGGDGTFHEVLNGVAGNSHVRLGFVPAGSGNDFRRGFRIPKNPISAFRYAIERIMEPPALVDTGKMVDCHEKETHFVNSIGAGFDALISKEANESRLKKRLNKISLGNLVYAYLVLKRVSSFRRTKVTVVVDGVPHHFEDTLFVCVSNQPYYGGGMRISPKASVIDGMLNITVVHQLSGIKFLFFFITVFWGGHLRFKEVKNLIGTEISIETEEPFPVHADGEYVGETPITIHTNSKALPLLIKEIES